MNRREALRLLAAEATISLTPGNLFALRVARAALGTPDAPRTLNPQQFAAIKMMAEMIIPKTDTPGAADVGAAEFIDLILTEWYAEEERTRFLAGLADMDKRSQGLFGNDFVECSAAERADILTALGAEMIEQAARNSDHSPRNRGFMPRAGDTFYPMLRRLTMVAYYTSEAGATEELKFEMIPDHFNGCVETHQQTSKGGSSQP
jgi:gluconate 2-dehydrogenase gamma chain